LGNLVGDARHGFLAGGTAGGSMTSPDTAAAAVPDAPAADAVTPAGGRGVLDDRPAAPEQSPEDTDIAWGDYAERGEDDLRRDRPPHWDDF
jgi:hypothetical protein